MNIGIDFDVNSTKVAFVKSDLDVDECKIFETKNILVFANGEIFVGEDGYNKFLTEKDSRIYYFDQIIEWNGLIVDKKQISVDKCLSIIFSGVIEKIKNSYDKDDIDYICISIPYDKYYYFHDLIKKSFNRIGINKFRIMSQPAAFFACKKIRDIHGRMIYQKATEEKQGRQYYGLAVKQYHQQPWYKKLFSKVPEYIIAKVDDEKINPYLFIVFAQNNTNVSLVEYQGDISEVVTTEYSSVFNRKIIENKLFDYFVSEINKDNKHYVIDDQKTILRITEEVNRFIKTKPIGKFFELNIPCIKCEDNEFRTINVQIDLLDLDKYIDQLFIDVAEEVKELTCKLKYWEKDWKIKNIIFVGEEFIYQKICISLQKYFSSSNMIFGDSKLISQGALNYSKILTVRRGEYLALEVIPFSVFVSTGGSEFLEIIAKNRTIPTLSDEYCFVVHGSNKSKFVMVHLTTKEGESYQSLTVWKIKINNSKAFKIMVDVDSNMKIDLKAYSHDVSKPFNELDSKLRMLKGQKPEGDELFVQSSNTFTFGGAGFSIGIKGRDVRQYILNQFNYLNAVFENQEVVVFEPDGIFYSMLSDGEPFKALRYLGSFLKLKSLPDVEMADSRFFEEQGIGGFISGSKISIPEYFKKDPYGFGYVLAHELAHYILINEEQIILEDKQENEILTEIFVIYKGMGKLFLNGFKSENIKGLSSISRGYLDEQIIKFIHEVYFARLDIDLTDYKNNLNEQALKVLE